MTVQSPPPPVAYPPAPYPTIPPPYRQTPPKSRTGWIIGIILGVIAAMVAVVAVVVIVANANKPAAPTGLRVIATTSTTATIAWNPASGTKPTRYAIYRNGDQVDTVRGAVQRTTDIGLRPTTTYSYQVSSYVDGTWSNRSAAVSATTKQASLADAVPAGTYNVHLKVTSEYGYTSIGPGDRSTESWWFKNKPNGTIVLMGETTGRLWDMPLTQNGHRYTGSTHATISTCQTTPVNTAISVKLNVLKGGMVGNSWAATRFEGTYKQVAPYSTSGLYTCPGAGITASVAGRVSH